MGNLTLFAALSLIMGILSGYSQYLNVFMVIALLPILLATGCHLIKNKNRCVFALFLLSFFVFGYFATLNDAANPLENHYGKEASVSGIIKTINRYDDSREYMSVVIESEIRIEDIGFNENLLVYIKRNKDISPGMSITGIGQLSKPNRATNFLEFDYRNYLNSQGIRAIFFMDEGFEVDQKIRFNYKIQNSFQQYITSVLDNNLNIEESNLLKGILLGDRTYIDEEILSNIRKLGVAHILAISGLHIGIIILSLNSILRALRLKRSVRIAISLLISWVYGYLIGFPASVSRALIMTSVISIGYLSHRRYNPLNSMIVTMMAMLIFKPLWLFDIGFQLSFAAVASIITYLKFVDIYSLHRFSTGLVLLIIIQLFTLPISIYYFNYFPLLSLMANMIFIPIVSYILSITILALGINLIIPWIASVLLLPVNFGLMLIVWLSESLMMFPINGFDVPSPTISEITLYYMLLCFVIFLALNRNEKYRFKKLYLVMASTVIIYIGIFLLIPTIFNNHLRISFIDTGQGLSSLIQYKNINFMVDAGGEISGEYQKTDYIFPEYLIKRGIRKLDTIFLSHYHRDHYSGINKISEYIDLKSFTSGYHNDELLSDLGQTKRYQINAGDELIIDEDLKLDVLWPRKGYIAEDENQNSLVMMLRYRDFRILFTGDINQDVEGIIKDDLRHADIVVVPHHGSNTSSGKEFIDGTSPKYGIISYGDNNYGLPSEEVIKRYEESDVNLLSTYEQGEIIINVYRNSSYNILVFHEKPDYNFFLFFILSGFFVFFTCQVTVLKRSTAYYEIQEYHGIDW
ncbi:MAG: Late competence protein ComEC, DNA transport [Clostridiales bacterium 38_11]|nr:MAG: Late competence protein ComEC, DNA transport [Clostridiales bacterium 38_11]HBH12493.1 DNA internalization-related competence protein ComEC/Rec2 [Clostridiales bacterium]